MVPSPWRARTASDFPCALVPSLVRRPAELHLRDKQREHPTWQWTAEWEDRWPLGQREHMPRTTLQSQSERGSRHRPRCLQPQMHRLSLNDTAMPAALLEPGHD